MTSYVVLVLEQADDRYYQRGRCELAHQCPPQWTQSNDDMRNLMAMALSGLLEQESDGPRTKCDLTRMSSIRPKKETKD